MERGKEVIPTFWRGEIPDCPPSANEFERLHWRARSRLIKAWYTEVYAAFRFGFPSKATKKRRVHVIVRSLRERDFSNQWLGVDKLIHDNLTKLGWIVDDSPKWIEPSITGEVGPRHTIIEILDLD